MLRSIASSLLNIALSLILLLTSFGCATTEIRSFSSPIPEDIRKNTHSIAVIPAGFTPANNLLTFAKGRDAGALKGAAFGTLEGIGALGHGAGSGGPYGAAAIVLLLPVFATIGAIGGSIEGAYKAIPAEEVTKIETLINQILQAVDVQNTMADNMVFKGVEMTPHRLVVLKGYGPSAPDARPDFTFISGQGNDITLEVGILEIGFHGGSGRAPVLSFFMNARIRAFQINDGKELHSDIFRYRSHERKFSEWAQNGAVELKEALETGYAEIAEAAIEKMFLLFEVKIDSTWSVAHHCMLEPLYPPQESLGFFSLQLNFPEIDTLYPTLKWESFPRDEDREADSDGILSRVSNITYELKIWEGDDGIPEKLIYSCSGLPAPEHTIGKTLRPGTEYFWTVRANFKLDGQERVTKWACSRIPWRRAPDPCRENLIPLYNYHRFKIIPR